MTTSPDTSSTTDKKETPTTVAELGPFDVLCGRDKKCSINGGNRRFRALINEHVSTYEGCDSKFERSKAIGAIVTKLQENPEGSVRFFKRVKGSDVNDDGARIEQLDEKQSREKVAHALRDYASQRRNNKAKQQSAASPPVAQNSESDYRIFPGSNDPHCGPSTQGDMSSQRLSELMREEAKLLAEIHALENAETLSSQAAYHDPADTANTNYVDPRQNGYHNNQLHSIQGTVNNYNLQGQNHHDQQYYNHQQHYQQYHNQQLNKQLEEDNEGSEGYDDFNVDDYNEFVNPLGSSIRQIDAPVASANDGSINRERQYLKQPNDQASEGYDNFDDRVQPLRSGSSRRSFAKSGSNRSVEKRGSLRQMDVFDKTGSSRSMKHQGSLRHMDVFENSGRRSMSKSQDSMDLMRMSMDTLTLNESEMMNESVLSFDQSKFDMSSAKLEISIGKLDSSMQQSKLDMSLQTIDTPDTLGLKRSSSKD